MGKNSKPQNEAKEYQLTEREFNLLKIMNLALAFNELKNKIISGYLYTICYNRLGYSDGVNLLFETDLDTDDGILKVKELDDDAIAQATQTA